MTENNTYVNIKANFIGSKQKFNKILKWSYLYFYLMELIIDIKAALMKKFCIFTITTHIWI